MISMTRSQGLFVALFWFWNYISKWEEAQRMLLIPLRWIDEWADFFLNVDRIPLVTLLVLMQFDHDSYNHTQKNEFISVVVIYSDLQFL